MKTRMSNLFCAAAAAALLLCAGCYSWDGQRYPAGDGPLLDADGRPIDTERWEDLRRADG
jgi:hypothetical protein